MNVKGIILAAGRGSRMREFTDDRPKCLVELHGQSLLDRQLTALREAGVQDVGIVTGYRRELLMRPGVTEFHNDLWDQSNMVSSLARAVAWLEQHICIVSYSDIFYEPSAVAALISCQASLAITYDPNWLDIWKLRFDDPLSDAETFRLSSDGRMTEIGNKPRSLAEVEGQYMGLLRFTPEGWREASRVRLKLSMDEIDRLQMTHLLQRIILAGNVPVIGVPYDGQWGEVDSPEDLYQYRQGLDRPAS